MELKQMDENELMSAIGGGDRPLTNPLLDWLKDQLAGAGRPPKPPVTRPVEPPLVQ